MVELIAENRRALSNFEISEKFEAGIRLTGSEIKSVRLKRVGLRGSFVKIIGGEAFVLNLKIDRYPYSSEWDYNPKRTRKLLLQKREIARLAGKTSQKGAVIVPLNLYLKNI
jgi:SsrA-binding protein